MAKAAEPELEQGLDRLYQLPPGEFTSARDELAKRFRADGRRDLADHVKQLRKPPAAVWLVNRLAHERELDVQRLAKAGAQLGKSQMKAAGGESSASFLDARREEHRALERLDQAGREIAARNGVGAAAVDRAMQTLRAASLTDEGRELLKRGRLTEELEPPGFEALAGLKANVPRRGLRQQQPDDKGERAARRQARKEAADRLRELRREERELANTARTATREAERAEKQASNLRARAEDARAAAEAGKATREDAQRELEQLK
jgi:hypothetical protein